MTPKDELRAAYLQRRRDISDEERQSAAKAAGVLFASFSLFKRSSYCAYLSNENEMPTCHLIRQIFAWNASLAIPAWDAPTKSYHLCAFHGQTKVITGHYGIREPEHHVPVTPSSIRLFLIPGVAFDTNGNRIGHGKGYYDAILTSAAPNALKVGLCYDWQITPSPIPAEPHDIPVDFLLTDRRILCCNPSKLHAKTSSCAGNTLFHPGL